jgi:hypothetical protein
MCTLQKWIIMHQWKNLRFSTPTTSISKSSAVCYIYIHTHARERARTHTHTKLNFGLACKWTPVMGTFHLLFYHGMWNIQGRRATKTWSWWGNPKQRDHFKDRGEDGKHFQQVLKKRAARHGLD